MYYVLHMQKNRLNLKHPQTKTFRHLSKTRNHGQLVSGSARAPQRLRVHLTSQIGPGWGQLVSSTNTQIVDDGLMMAGDSPVGYLPRKNRSNL